MPPKKTNFLKPGGKSKQKDRAPESENEFLEAADELEQAAGKWRAGDAAKAMRFSNRAIDAYSAGLARYPTSFDLAYNKANLQYHMSQDPRIASLLGSRLGLLQETLRTHRFALSLLPENADVLFNTAQVLTSLAEALLEGSGHASQDQSKASARQLLEEGVDLFSKCLRGQKQEYEAHLAEVEAIKSQQLEQEGVDPTPIDTPAAFDETMETSSTSSGPAEWATVEELIQPEHVLETCIAQLEAMTTLIELYSLSDQEKIEGYIRVGDETIDNYIPTYITLFNESPFTQPAPPSDTGPTLSISTTSTIEEPKTSPPEDALVASAKFKASIFEFTYRANQTTASNFAQTIAHLFTQGPLSISIQGKPRSHPHIINIDTAYADALLDTASAISDSPLYNPSAPDFQDTLTIQWTCLTQAQSLLTALSKQTSTLSPARLADVFLARGDADLFRFRISLFPSAKPEWVRSKATLVANAGVFYRGARAYAEKAGAEDMQQTADAKAIVAEILKEAESRSGIVNEHWKGRSFEVRKVLEGMVEEGIVGRDDADWVWRLCDKS